MRKRRNRCADFRFSMRILSVIHRACVALASFWDFRLAVRLPQNHIYHKRKPSDRSLENISQSPHSWGISSNRRGYTGRLPLTPPVHPGFLEGEGPNFSHNRSFEIAVFSSIYHTSYRRHVQLGPLESLPWQVCLRSSGYPHPSDNQVAIHLFPQAPSGQPLSSVQIPEDRK